ncbi:hypothetical protein DPEC_G00270380 [Dallia pectoralis]|uniref:Uncharacterized protein n=1 Tax=Dallia pectoralis TaxID=75939 RepID=A0ACC2FPG5_DALPE|nr:hypothetical protein DPEC_G00270380 [Dallia pectoralis]
MIRTNPPQIPHPPTYPLRLAGAPGVRLNGLKPEPCRDKTRHNGLSVVTTPLPGKTPRCEIKDTRRETKLSAHCIGRWGPGKPDPIVVAGAPGLSGSVSRPQGQ